MGLQIGLSLSSLIAASGGGPVPVAPVIVTPGSIDAQPLVGQSILLTEPEVTGADSVAYQWYEGDPDTADPISGWTSENPTPTDAEYPLPDHIWRRATYTNGAGDTVEDLEAPDVVGKTYSDDWSAYAVADDFADLDAVYDRTASNMLPSIVADANGPDGKALRVPTGTNAVRLMWQTAAAAFGIAQAANTARSQALFAFKHIGDQQGRYYLRFINSALTATDPGVLVYNGNAQLQIDTDSNNSNVGTLLDTLVVGDYYLLLLEQAGAQIRGKLWPIDDPIPGAFTDRTCSGPITPAAPAWGFRQALSSPSDQFDLLWWSVGFNTDAPFWSGYVPPPPSTSDLMTFAAASSQSSVSFADGAMIINLEDV